MIRTQLLQLLSLLLVLQPHYSVLYSQNLQFVLLQLHLLHLVYQVDLAAVDLLVLYVVLRAEC